MNNLKSESVHCDGCPYFNDVMRHANDQCQEDIIRMNTDTDITDKHGNKIIIRVPSPEYIPETFGK